MHEYMWFGYDLGPFLFEGLDISTRWAFGLTWIALFLVSVLFEASKVYLAKVQRAAQKRLFPYRSDERRNLLCQEQGGMREPGTSRNASSGQVGRWASLKTRVLINSHQSIVFVAHNTVGYLLMLAVMVYNVHLLIAVVFGMMLGYFLFGAKLTRLQMQCFRTKRVVICTPECDDTAENSTPPLLDASLSSESDFFICQTRTCIQPAHYFRASTSQDGGQETTCHYGAKSCPSKVARVKKLESSKHCHSKEPSVEDAQLLGDQCCKKKDDAKAEVVVHERKYSKGEGSSSSQEVVREASPQITCCHNVKVPSESQEQIM